MPIPETNVNIYILYSKQFNILIFKDLTVKSATELKYRLLDLAFKVTYIQ